MQQDSRCFATENIDRYMNDIRRYSLISIKDENRLSDIIRNGTPAERQAARDQLVCANLKLVVKIAHDFKHLGVGLADLVSEGNIGLMIAAGKFDPSKGAKFSCYSAWWIKQAMRKAIAWQSRTIRIPLGCAQRIASMERAAEAFMADNGRAPTDDELSEITGFSTTQLEHMYEAVTETYSMCDTVNETSQTTFDQMLSDTADDDDADRLARISAVDSAIDGLSDLDRTLVYQTYGFDGPVQDVRAIAQEVGMSVASVRRRISDIAYRLRVALSAV